jgi:hypothetical protein
MRLSWDNHKTEKVSKYALGASFALLILTGLFLKYGFNDQGGYNSNLFYGPLRLGLIGILIDIIIAVLVLAGKPLVACASVVSGLCIVNSVRLKFTGFGYAVVACLISFGLLVFWMRYGDAMIGVPGVPTHSPLAR